MNRIIKFRAWDKDDKKMIDLSEISHDAFSICLFHDLCIKGKSKFENKAVIHEYAIMQFIGLIKNGKEVYEGDIIKSDDEIGVVKFEDCEFVAMGKEDGGGCWNLLIQENAKVIGNVFENPELLSN